MKKLLIMTMMIVFLMPVWVWGATWYVRPVSGEYGAEDGTSYEAAYDGFSNISWAAISAGDTLYVCGAHVGQQLYVSKSGTSGNPITIRGDYPGDPGSITSIDELVETGTGNQWNAAGATWTDNGSNIWTFSPSVASYRLKIDGTERVQHNNTGVTSAEPWYRDGNTLYVYATENPKTAYSSITGNVATTYPILSEGADYLTYTNLTVSGGYVSVKIYFSSYVTVENCTIGDMAYTGIYITGHPGTYEECVGIRIQNNVVDSEYAAVVDNDTHGDGIQVGNGVNHSYVNNNTISDWGHCGLSCVSDNANFTNGISYNKLHENTITCSNVDYCTPLQISGYQVGGTDYCHHNNAYNNTIHDCNVTTTINGDYNMFHHNLIYNIRNESIRSGKDWVAFGLRLNTWETTQQAKYCSIFNNTIYDTDGLGIRVFNDANSYIQNNTIENNIMLDVGKDTNMDGYDNHVFDVENDSTYITNNTIRNNIGYISGQTDIWKYRGTSYNTTSFNAADSNSDTIAGNISSDPLFTDAPNNDFTLTSTSPCINKGTDPFSDGDGDQTDMAGETVWSDTTDKPVGTWRDGPDIGAYGYFLQTNTASGVKMTGAIFQ
jgi:parallel beta-helix repeat protein